MERDCCKVLNFERGGLWMKFAEDALAGMMEIRSWQSSCKDIMPYFYIAC